MPFQSVSARKGSLAAPNPPHTPEYVRLGRPGNAMRGSFLLPDSLAPPALGRVVVIGARVRLKMPFEVRHPLVRLSPATLRADKVGF